MAFQLALRLAVARRWDRHVDYFVKRVLWLNFMIFESKSEHRANLGVNVAQKPLVFYASIVPALRESRPWEMISGEKFSYYSCSAAPSRWFRKSIFIAEVSITSALFAIGFIDLLKTWQSDYILTIFTIRTDNRGRKCCSNNYAGYRNKSISE